MTIKLTVAGHGRLKIKNYSNMKMNKKVNIWALIVLLGLTISCADDDSTMRAPESVENKALTLISGTVTESEPEIEEGIAAWKVDIRTDQGAEVEIYCRQDNGNLLRIDGESGPFDYNINPSNGLIDFNEAKSIGVGVTSETLGKWQLRMEDKYSNDWVYSLEYTSTKLFIKATDGNVLDIEN